MKILVASDSFKGTMASSKIGRIVQEELSPFHDVDWMPVSDGGEGFVDAWRPFFPGRLVTTGCRDPLGRAITCSWFLTDDKTAIIESASAVGLGWLAETERNPMVASSYGLGMVILDAIRQGAEKVYTGLGGSAVNDGGLGLLRALGARILDCNGQEVSDDGGRVLSRLSAIDTSAMEPLFRNVTVFAVCDVENPLLGPLGATRVYGPQKGATPAMVEALEAGMAHLAEVAGTATGLDFRDTPGAGASGGLGFCLMSFLGAKMLKGMEALLHMTRLEERIGAFDLIITGEGRLDDQTGSGKVPAGILRLGQLHKIPVICLCGLNESTTDMGFREIFPIVPQLASVNESMASPDFYLRKILREEVIPWIDAADILQKCSLNCPRL